MFWDDENWTKFVELKKKIQDAGFLREAFHYIDFKDKKTYKLIIYNKIRTRKTSPGSKGRPSKFHLKKNEILRIQVHEHAKKVDSFFFEYAKILWDIKQSMEPIAEKEHVADIKELNLYTAETFLRKEGYGKKTIKKIILILDKDLNKRLEEQKKHQDFKYHVYPIDKPKSPAWILRENSAIAEIRNLYKKYTPQIDK